MRRRVVALAVAAAIGLSTVAGRAQTSRQHLPAGDKPVLFVADEVQYDQELGIVVARGHVEISEEDQVLLADTVTYNQRTDTVTASGNVSLLQPTGDVLFGDFIELHDQMREGFIQNVRGLLSDHSRFAGNSARRSGGNRTEIRRGVYSPCDLCVDNPSAPPAWQIKAERIVHDKEAKLVEYHDAFLEVDGVPIFWSPYLSSPDPSVRRQSGLLAPTIGLSSTLGAHLGVPYYWVIDPSRDMTIEPIVTTRAGGGVAAEYRQRFSDGHMELRGSGAYTNRPTGPTGEFLSPIDAFRGNYAGQGEFDIDDTWRTLFDVNRASDQTYTRRFHFGSSVGFDSQTGTLITNSSSFLVSNATAEGFTDRSYAVVDSYLFQSLRAGTGDTTQPVVLPVGTYSWWSQPDGWGGRWSGGANALNIFQSNGTAIRRVSTGAGWTVPFDGAIGDRFTFSTSIRADAYDTDNIGTPTAALTPFTGVSGRIYPTAELEWRYPWVRRGNGYSQVIEPIVAAIVAPNGGNPAKIPNEDSTDFEFSDASLFIPNRFPGYDQVDPGQRVDYGLSGGFYGDNGGATRFLIGQSYRLQEHGPYPAGSGIPGRFSNVVGRVMVSPAPWLDFFYRFSLEPTDLTPERQEAGILAGPSSFRVNLSFINLTKDPLVTENAARRQVSGTVITDLTRYWSLGIYGTQSVGSNSENLNAGIAATYHDECLAFTVTLSHSGTSDRDIKPGTSLLFTVTFKNLGQATVRPYSTGSTGPVPPL
ncbi:MAG TPA: LPS assembly protein LptD [Stellaceae bacterium]|nr:LPS assembly protein LptD [Stellaceae bacterium]